MKILKSTATQNFDTIDHFPKNDFTSFVGSKSQTSVPGYLILIDPENLYFSVKIPETKNYDKNLKLGQFKEELWKQDVIELFIAADEGNSYQEFNFSPVGAYWTAKFSEYRKLIPNSDSPIPEIKIESRAVLTGRVLLISLPLKIIITGCSFNNKSRLNCCAIFGDNQRNFYSTASLDSAKPDFHEIASWGMMNIEMVS